MKDMSVDKENECEWKRWSWIKEMTMDKKMNVDEEFKCTNLYKKWERKSKKICYFQICIFEIK